MLDFHSVSLFHLAVSISYGFLCGQTLLDFLRRTNLVPCFSSEAREPARLRPRAKRRLENCRKIFSGFLPLLPLPKSSFFLGFVKYNFYETYDFLDL